MSWISQPAYDGYTLKQSFWTRQQEECFVKLLPQRHSLLAMQPRCGKSKPIVDKACYYFERPSLPLHVNAVLVIAFPSGVHHGWIADAFPDNVPKRIKWKGLTWHTNKCRQVGFRTKFKDVCLFDGLAVLSINVEAITADITRRAIVAFIKARKKVFVVFDESSALVNGNAERSKVMMAIGKLPEVVMTACLDGTPVDKNGPLDYWSQIGWMSMSILGYSNPTEFKYHFAEIVVRGRGPFWAKVRQIKDAKVKEGFTLKDAQDIALRLAKTGKLMDDGKERPVKRGRDWWTEIDEDDTGRPKFKNMDELWAKLDPISYRATFKQCFPNSKDKIYQKRRFELSEEQRRVYDELAKEHRATIASGEEIKGEHPLTRQLRAQQITSNYYPEQDVLSLHVPCGGMGCEGCGETGIVESTIPMRVIDSKHHPRLDALREELKAGKPTVVWARFRQDVTSCYQLAESMGLAPCRYDGAVGSDAKVDAKEGFQSGKYGVIVGNQFSMSRGLPLFRAQLLVGYSNMFSFRCRQQVEDRAEHGSKVTATEVVDLVANETVDDLSIIPALRQGLDVSTWVMRDEAKVWI